MSAQGSIIAKLGLDKKDFRTGMDAAKGDLGTFKTASQETAAAIALLQRNMKASGGTDEQKRQLADLTRAHKQYQREIRTTENQIKALGTATGGGGGGMFSGLFNGLRGLGGTVSGLSGIGSVLGSLGSVGGIVSLGKELMDFAHTTKIAADSVNMDVEGFQRFRAVFGKKGADEEVFTHSLAKLTENIDGARQGNAKLEESFNGLGVSFADLTSLSPEKILLKIADAAAHSTDPTRTFAEVVDVLGKTGMKMLPGLKMGGDAIEEMGKKATVASREAIAAGEAAQKRFGGFVARQTGATLEGAYRYVDAYRHADGASGAAGTAARDLLGDQSPAAGSGSKVIEALRAPIVRGPIGVLSRFTRGIYTRAFGGGDVNDGSGSAPDVTTLGGGAPAPAAGPAAPAFKGALELKRDELALEERLRAIRRAGDDAEVKAAGEKLAAARDILANAEKNPANGEMALAGLRGNVTGAEDAERLARRASVERKEEMADQMALNDLQERGAAARLLALDQEEARLRRRLNSPEYGADEKAGFSLALSNNAAGHADARRAFLSENDQNRALEIENRHGGRGTAARIGVIDDLLAENVTKKGRENSGDVSREAVGRWQRLNLEAKALRREKADLLFGDKQALEAAKATTREMQLQGWGQRQVAEQAAIRARAEREIAQLAHNRAPAAQIAERAKQRDIELNQLAADEYQKTPEQRAADADAARARVRAMNATNPNFHTRDVDREGSVTPDASEGRYRTGNTFAFDADAFHPAAPIDLGGWGTDETSGFGDPEKFAKALAEPLGKAMAAAFLEATANTEPGD